jgi:hypothetical protein
VAVTLFVNNTSPGQLPVEGDQLDLEVNGVLISRHWNIDTLNLLISEKLESSNPITPLEFRRLFPPLASIIIDGFEKDDSLTEYQRSVIRTYMKTFDKAPEVYLDDPDVQGALSLFVSLGWLTEEEKVTIISNGLG